MANEIKPYRVSGFVILNASGQIWDPKIYDTAEAAQRVLDAWSSQYRMDLSKHRIVPGYSVIYAEPVETSNV